MVSCILILIAIMSRRVAVPNSVQIHEDRSVTVDRPDMEITREGILHRTYDSFINGVNAWFESGYTEVQPFDDVPRQEYGVVISRPGVSHVNDSHIMRLRWSALALVRREVNGFFLGDRHIIVEHMVNNSIRRSLSAWRAIVGDAYWIRLLGSSVAETGGHALLMQRAAEAHRELTDSGSAAINS
jgi:hypothetical protein